MQKRRLDMNAAQEDGGDWDGRLGRNNSAPGGLRPRGPEVSALSPAKQTPPSPNTEASEARRELVQEELSEPEPNHELQAARSQHSLWKRMPVKPYPARSSWRRPAAGLRGPGLQFCGLGFGIGDRIKQERHAASPGCVYNRADVGSISMFDAYASHPTKQPFSNHRSSEAHTIGARRPVASREAGLGPGYYD